MAEEQDSSAEKSQEPTQRRLDKAREEGDMARSQELNTMAVLLAGSAGMLLFGAWMGTALAGVMRHSFTLDRAAIFDGSAMFQHLGAGIMDGLGALIPLFLLLLVAAVLGPMALNGWNFALKAIAPKANRMNPASGLKRMFGTKALMELAKAIAKVTVVASIAALIFYLNKDSIMNIQREETGPAIVHTLSIVAWAVLAMSCAMILIAAVDIPFQIHHHVQKLRMTLQQVKDERKDTDGRPEVKQRIRQLQYDMAQNRMMGDVPDADVIITNPEHYAVALRYRQDAEGAPVLLAAGVDFMAQRIREVAAAHDIPVVRSPALARAIHFNTRIGEQIPAGLYMAVAQVLAYIYQLRNWRPGDGQPPQLADELPIPPDLRRN